MRRLQDKASAGDQTSARGAVQRAPGKRTLVQQRYGALQRSAPAPHNAPTGESVHAVADAGLSGAGEQLPHLEQTQESFGAHDVTGVGEDHAQRRAGEAGTAPGAAAAVERAAGSHGEALPVGARARFEGALDTDLSAVRVHTGEESATAAGALDALAYTVGQDIHFGAGQYAPESRAGQELLAHEVAHTVQQGPGGAVVQGKLEVTTPGDALEHEADAAAAAMVEGRPASVSPATGLARKVIALKDDSPGKADDEGGEKDGQTEDQAPPDAETLFGDGPEWAEVRQVEAETADKATHETPKEAHDHRVGAAWGWMPSFGAKRLYNWWTGGEAEGNEALATQIVREQLVSRLGQKLNTDITIGGFKLDLRAGLVTAASVNAGPMLFDLTGHSLLIAGATLHGLEVQFSLADLYRLYARTDTQDALTIRFTSLTIPQLHLARSAAPASVGEQTATSEPVGPVTPLDDTPVKLREESGEKPGETGAVASPTATEPEARAPAPSSGASVPALVQGVLDSLRLGFHVAAVDVEILAQDGPDVTLRVSLQHGAVRAQLNSAFWAPVSALTEGDPPPAPVGRKVQIGDRASTLAELKWKLEDTCVDRSPWGDQVDEQARGEMARTHLGPLRAARQDESLTRDEEEDLDAMIAFLEGSEFALDEREGQLEASRRQAEEREQERLRKAAAERKAEAAKRAAALGSRGRDEARGGRGLSIEGLGAAVAGKNVTGAEHTSARLQIGRVEARGIDVSTDTSAHVGKAALGPLDVRLLGNQLGVQLGGVSAEDVQVHRGSTTGASVESLELGSSRVAARVRDLTRPEDEVVATGHLGALGVHGLGAMSGDHAVLADHVRVGATDLSAHKRGATERVAARGLGVDVLGLAGASGDTVGSASSLRLAPSAVNATRSAPEIAPDTGTTARTAEESPERVVGGSVTLGAMEADEIELDQPREATHARVDHLGVGGVAASLEGSQVSGLVQDVEARGVHAERGEHELDLGSAHLDRVTATGETTGHTGHLAVGKLDARTLAATIGKGTPDQLGVAAESVALEPTTAQVHSKTASLHHEGMTIERIGAKGATTAGDIKRIQTGALDVAYDAGLELELERLEAEEVSLARGDGASETTLQVGDVALVAPQAYADHEGGLVAGFEAIRVGDVALESVARGDGTATSALGPRGTAQRWETHEQRAHVDRARMGSVGLGNGRQEGHKALSAEGFDLRGVELTSKNASDRHTHLLQKATLQRDQAVAAADTLLQVRIREAKQQAEADLRVLEARHAKQAADPKKSATAARTREATAKKIDQALSKALAAAQQEHRKAVRGAEAALEKVRAAGEKAARKEEREHTAAKTKARGTHAALGSLTLGQVEADLTGVDEGTPHVEDVAIERLEGHGIQLDKLLDDVERLTVEVEDISLVVDEAHTGTVTVRIRMGHDMLENLAGSKVGTTANALVGLDDNTMTLTVGVQNGLVDLATLAPSLGHNPIRAKLIKKALARIHVGGDKPRKKLHGEHRPPHLHLPGVGDRELEQLGLAGLHSTDKRVLVSRKIHGGRGGVHLKNLLESGLQAAIDQQLGGHAPSSGGVGPANVAMFSVGELDLRGADLTHRTGARPGALPVDERTLEVESLALGGTIASLDDVPPVAGMMAALRAMLTGTKAPSEAVPEASTASLDGGAPTARPPGGQTSNPSSDQTGMLDGLFALLESLGGGSRDTGGAKSGGAKPGGAKSGGAKSGVPNRRLGDGTGAHDLDVFNTGGGGDCGIHAMFGRPQLDGTTRATHPAQHRDQLADALAQGDGRVDQQAFIALFVDLVLKLLNPRGAPGGDSLRERQAFMAVPGFWDAVRAANLQDDAAYAAHARDRDGFIDGLITTYLLDEASPVGDAMREHLIENFLRSNSPGALELRHRLQAAPDRTTRHRVLMAAPHLLRAAIVEDFDSVIVIADSAGAAPAVWARHAQLDGARQQLGGSIRQVVTQHIAPLLGAYANVVRAPGYYLHAEDLQLLARLNDLDLHVFREHDQHAGEFVEQLHQPAVGGNRVDVFHSGVHYERSRYT